MDQARGVTDRFLPLDGLRGLAALAVALYHFQQRVPHLDAALPRAVSIALQHGNLGVQVFFVLSGFAVARSLASTQGTFARFFLRRAIRLDPPYVFTVLLVSGLALHNPSGWPVRPTLSLVTAHVFYLQGLLGMYHLQGVFWTLCIEIQLYAAFGLLFTLGRRLDARVFSGLVVLTAALAAFVTWSTPAASRHLLPFWPSFCLGVLVERTMRARETLPFLLALSFGMLIAVLRHPQLEAAIALATTAILVVAAATRLGAWLSSKPLLFLGKISYSFYLLHALVGGVVLEAMVSRGVASDVTRVLMAFAASGAAALALHHALEVPAQRWSRRVAVR